MPSTQNSFYGHAVDDSNSQKMFKHFLWPTELLGVPFVNFQKLVPKILSSIRKEYNCQHTFKMQNFLLKCQNFLKKLLKMCNIFFKSVKIFLQNVNIF